MNSILDNNEEISEENSREVTNKNYFFEGNNRIFLIEYNGDIVNALKNFKNTSVHIIDEKRAVVTTPYEIYFDVLRLTPEIVYIDLGDAYTTCDISPIEASEAITFHNNIYLPLDGSGVIVGILDTGIDYLNEEFINEDGTSRILGIMDRSIPNNKPETGFMNSVYTQEDINRAIQVKKNGGDPYSVVPSKDEIGHGTNMSGIIAGRGVTPGLIGAAPRCGLAVVKLNPAFNAFRDYYQIYGNETVYQNSGIVLGIKYLYDLAVKLKKPIVIYIPLSANTGPHNGNAFIEKYITEISTYNGVAVVVPSGNQGNSDTHTSGIIKSKGDEATIEVQVGKNQENIRMQIWISKPDKVALSITSPTGEVIRNIYPKLKTTLDVAFLYEETKMTVEYYIPEELTGEQKIVVIARNIREGIWQFKLRGELIIVGRYDAWLLQRCIIAPDTKFLNPVPTTTLTTPGTSKGAITVGFYNQNNNSIVAESGKGYTRNNMVKPDIVAAGINAITTTVGGKTQTVTGSSVAAAIVVGACALIFQWGIILENDTTMFATKVKTYLIRGAQRRTGDVYPNPQWGYGMLSLKGVFDNIRSEKNNIDNNRNYEKLEFRKQEYYINSLFVRLPNNFDIHFKA